MRYELLQTQRDQVFLHAAPHPGSGASSPTPAASFCNTRAHCSACMYDQASLGHDCMYDEVSVERDKLRRLGRHLSEQVHEEPVLWLRINRRIAGCWSVGTCVSCSSDCRFSFKAAERIEDGRIAQGYTSPHERVRRLHPAAGCAGL